jgi:ADP-heptose:LPS heptosyltransferase
MLYNRHKAYFFGGQMARSKAFFVNGGAGRMVSSIPAFEKYQEESDDKDFIIVCEGGSEIFKGHPTLEDRVFDIWHKNLFKDKLTHRDIITTEPYRIWEYYTQQCSIAQAFDIQINNKGIRPMPKPTLKLSKEELLQGRSIVSEVKKKLKKEKLVVFQPFGRSIEYIDETLVDKTARSFELKDVKSIVKKLQLQDYAIIFMSEFKVDLSEAKLKDEVAMPENVNMRVWAAIIKYADAFLGCDSLGQHLAYCVDTPATVVTGSTFPINVSYPDVEGVDILDMGELNREYSPIRILPDDRVDRKNENIMTMNDEITTLVVNHVLGKKE